ncbi:MAG: 4Fe-4S binding protein [Deltaproteobacteria bacterium]|nr:4Fe-4S binding protein [Deltaproteobacteria bacterium]
MINFTPDRCQSWLYKKADCRLCVEACPVEGCISFKDSQLIVKAEECVGCGVCTTVCPTSALEMEGLTDRELLSRLMAALPENTTSITPQPAIRNPQSEIFLTIGCSLGSKDSKSAICNLQSAIFINLPCLAILKESHLISLVLSGTRNIYLDLTRCGDCSFKHGRKTIEKTMSYASSLLGAMGYEDRLQTSDFRLQTPDQNQNKKSILSFRKNKKNNIKTITPEPEYSRRELLHFFREKAVEKAVERVVGKTNRKKGGGKKAGDVPERREILLEILGKEKNIVQSNQIKDGSFPVHSIRIDDDCTLCNDCNLFCPTGALAKVEQKAETDDETGEVRLDFNMSLCMGCEQCAELCPEDAMSLVKDINLSDFASGSVQTLFSKVSKKCPSCNRVFYPEDGMEGCLICKKRKDSDDMFFNAIFSQQDMQ